MFRYALLSQLLAASLLLAISAHAEDEDEEGPEIVSVSRIEDVPERCRNRVKGHLDALPEGYTLYVGIGQYYDMGKSTSTNRFQPFVASLVPVDARGKPDGVELHFEAEKRHHYREVPFKKGEKEGVERIYPTEGKRFVEAEIPWDNDRIHGVRKSYYPDGQVRTETHYRKDRTEGLSRSFAPDGSVTRESTMRKGKRHGVTTDYWPRTGNPKRVVTYDKGKVEGMVKEYYADGKIKRELPFRHDAMHGIEKQYDPDGTVVRVRFWRDGDPIPKHEYEGER